ncbi:TIM44-like domain-containing protein [Xanthobacter autotrophicus]|nr:TIM44-like domain-containing protein [Xanthobacter autotrophicus]MDI4665901.1 TIM44-like domain-containing protein [Xanthobacter autotrophicus]
MFRKRTVLAALAVAGALTLVAANHADARQGGSFGSRGTRTYQTPAATPTAPGTVAPVQRSTAPQQAPSAAARPQTAAPRPSMFGNGFAGSLMRGLLIGGLVGLLLGQGLGGLAGMLGLLLQVGLVVLGVMLVLRLMRGARQPVPAGAGASGSHRTAPGDWRAAPMPPAGSGRPPGAGDEIGITPADLDSFERLLGLIQGAVSREDQAELRAHTTPEMFGYLADELRDNAERGLRNEVSDVKLLQGDVAEAWREGNRDYATVAMRYASRDVMVDRASGRIVSGDAASPGESTEVWTFVRDRIGGPTGGGLGAWRLSAIQGA